VRTVIVSNIISVDGSFEGPGGDVTALNMDTAFDAYNLERIRAAGSVLLGRRSFEGFSSYWPNIADAPVDPSDRALSDDNRELSRRYDPPRRHTRLRPARRPAADRRPPVRGVRQRPAPLRRPSVNGLASGRPRS
jgi:hypothetical protein